MTCDECQEQVFELIEREAAEPEAVREILARCPECRALFEEMKAALADASQLPVEEPPSEIDEIVLRAARSRAARNVSRPRRWYRSPQWAVAATALLAIGIGVWAIPRTEPVAMRDAPQLAGNAGGEVLSLTTEERVELDDASDQADAFGGVEEAPEPARAPHSVASKTATPQKRRSTALQRRDTSEAGLPPAESEGMAAAERAPSSGASLRLAPVGSDAAPEATKELEKPSSSECDARLAKLEGDEAVGVEEKVGAEDALAIGRCYQASGNFTESRRWLERAASDPKTRRRAIRALKELPPP